MRGTAAMFATLITLSIGTAAFGAMSADLRSAADRIEAREQAIHQLLDPIWYGGQLAPVVVQAAPDRPAPRAARRVPAPAKRAETRIAVQRIS